MWSLREQPRSRRSDAVSARWYRSTAMSRPVRLPWLPEGRLVRVEGGASCSSGSTATPTRRAGRAAAARLDGLERPAVLHRLRGARRALHVRRHRPPWPRPRPAVAATRSRSRTPPTTPRPPCATSASARSSPSATRWAARSRCTSPGATPTSSPGSSCRPRRSSGAETWRERAAVAGPADRRVVAAQPGLPPLPQPGRAEADRRRPRPSSRTCRGCVSEMSRNDAFAMVDAGRALAALRRPAVGVVARRAGGAA